MDLNYKVKGERAFITNSNGERVGFVSLVFESGQDIKEAVDGLAEIPLHDEIDRIISNYELARWYASIFGGHTVPETVAGFAVCNYKESTCDLILEDFRVGTLYDEKDKKIINSWGRYKVSIQEGDKIACGNSLFTVNSVTICPGGKTMNEEMYATLYATCELAKNPDAFLNNNTGHSRSGK